MRRFTRLASLLLVAFVLAPAATLDVESAGLERKPTHHLSQGYRNLDDGYRYGMGVRVRHFILGSLGPRRPMGTALAVLPNDGAEIRANGTHPTATWVGHSTFLVQLDGVNILTDPIWSDRASPVGFAGPRRLVPPGLAFADLPADPRGRDLPRPLRPPRRADGVAPGPRAPAVVLRAAGPREWLRERGITEVVEMDWWESATSGGSPWWRRRPSTPPGGRSPTESAALVVVGVRGQSTSASSSGATRATRRGWPRSAERLGPFDVADAADRRLHAFTARPPQSSEPGGGVQLFEDLHGSCSSPCTGERSR